jgi:hypothetical protein
MASTSYAHFFCVAIMVWSDGESQSGDVHLDGEKMMMTMTAKSSGLWETASKAKRCVQ